ncbi:MAG: MASE1 domain-containing protein [Pseudomonadota bacterium]
MPPSLHRLWRDTLGITAFSVLYAAIAWLGYQLVPGIAKVTPIWFPAALALTVLLVHRLRYWPGAFLGPLLFSAIIDVPFAVSLASCLGNLASAVLGAVLLRRTGFDPAMSRFQDGVKLIFLGAALPNLIGALIGGVSLYLGGLAAKSELYTIFLFWFLSDTDGVLVLTPLLLAAAGYAPAGHYLARWQELGALLLCALLVATVTYGYYGLNPGNPLPTYLMFPLAIWAVLRFDAVIVGLVLFGAIAFGISGNVAADNDTALLHAQLLELQTFVGVLAATCILIGAFRRQEAASRQRIDELARTEQDRLEKLVAERTADLRAANHELAAFNRAVSHDLRTPLNGFSGLLELLESDLHDKASPRIREYLRGLRTSTLAMQQMITALLNLSLSQHRELVLSRVDFSALCRDVLAELRQSGETPATEVAIEDGLVVQADPVLMRVLVQNLLDNALKYSAETMHPQVTVGIRELDGRRWIAFTDNGIGFGEEGPSTLFEPFQRLANARHLRGTGIGLTTVRRIVERHRGMVRAERCAEGGACFLVWLP